MSIGALCQDNVVTIMENASIQEAAKIMLEKNTGCLLVLKNDKPIGVITDRDITTKIVSKKTDLQGVSVQEAMSADLLVLPSDMGIKQAIEAMRDKGVRRAPVMENEQVCGMIKVDDLMIMIAAELHDLADLVQHQLSGQK